MRSQRAPLFKLAAYLAVAGFLFGVGAASAVERDEKVSRDPQQIQKPVHFKSIGTGKYRGLPFFLKELGSSECSSSCCWASASCDSPHTSCTKIGCDAWCDGGPSSHTDC